jgi:predicted Zn-dependent protease
MINCRLAQRVLALLLAAAFAAPLSARAQLPTLGDTSEMNASAERKLGERIARELYRDPDYIDDPVLDEYVQGIWKKLLQAARTRGELTAELDERFAWQVLLGKDRSINAFALPGGWLGLHLGLISTTGTRDELASVLAHELSHVTQRHISRLVTQQTRQAPWMIAGMILGALAASKNPEAANAMVAGGQAMAMQNQLNFSRDMEREADRIGFGVMTQAGFEPQGFVSMFDKLQQAARLNDNGSFPYLRTHPMNTERIADMQSRQQLAARTSAAPNDLLHAMMAGRARVMSNPGVDALRSYLKEAESAQAASNRARQAGALYAGALASARLRDAGTANRLLGKLSSIAAGDVDAVRASTLLAAEVAFLSGDPTRAMALTDGASAGRPEIILSSMARNANGRAAESAQRLQTWVALHPRDAQAWQLLAAAYTAQGQTLRAIRAEAESRVAHLDYQAAMDRFKAAQELARRAGPGTADHIEASIIDTRARQVELLLREQAAER